MKEVLDLIDKILRNAGRSNSISKSEIEQLRIDVEELDE